MGMGNLSGMGFDANEVPEQQDFSAVPKDVYPLIVVESEMKPTKNGSGEFLNCTIEVLDGQYKGRKMWARMNLKNVNQQAVDIAQRELAALCRAVGVPRPQDSSELHNIPFLGHVDVEIDDRKRENNVIKKYEPINAWDAQQSAPQAQQRAFTSARSAASDTANSYSPAATQPAAGAAARPVWKR